ncbi:MAG: oligosaccharide flippase family protein [Candidatus Nomurabacteria bacterium]|nr:oligosaccharide flippase family protein [Candidatus Nomurabacteria bacterium]
MVDKNYFLKSKIKNFLRKTEKYTKTDMVYIAQGGFWTLFSQVIGSLSSFAVVVILANILTKEDFGQYRFVISIVSILIIFTLPGLSTSITRSVARKQIIDFSKIIKAKIYWGFIGSLATLLVAGYYFYNSNIEITYALILSALFLPFIEPFAIYSAYFKGKQDFKTTAIYESISRVFQALVIIAIALITHSILALLSAYFIGQIIARLFFYRKTLKDEKTQNIEKVILENKSDDTIKYGKHLSATQIINTITANIDKLLVWHFLGAEILAIYYIALTIPKNIVLLCNIIPRIALPKFSQNTWDQEERTKVIKKLFKFFYILIIPALMYFFLVPFVLPFIFKNYSTSVSIAIILSFLIILAPMNTMIGQILQSMKSIKKIICLQIISLITFIATFFILYIVFGASPVVAATALVASEASAVLVGVFLIKKEL